MVEFLKSSASVDSQGRRLNDAELQSHALRLAKSIPSASRMRCSFGWLRHFKRRLGVQWAADKLGRYRWIVEMDHQASGSEGSTFTPSPAPLTNNTNVKQERHGSVISTTEDDEEYHSSNEFGSDDGSVTPIVHNDNSSLSMHSASHGNTKSSSSQQPSSHSIINSFPGLFGALPPLHIPGGPSSMGTISPLATTLDPKLTSNVLSPPATTSSAFGMSVDGKMRKVPTKEEAYDMLQSLLMYYEQDHSYNGEQQTLLLPRWIHQQRQIMQHTPETEAKTIWMRQQQQLYQPFQQDLLFPFQTTSPLPLSTEAQHPYHRYSSSFSSTVSSTSSTLSPSLSPVSPALPLTPQSPTLDPFGLGFTGSATAPGFSDPFVSASAKSDVTFSSALTGLGQHILSADPSLLF
ncbi:hypothetical protein B0O80DRAFT_433453 [Mortierella sp. GBAus27b]|nr:hypothetical protein B0O80DRAFT_433453 [Mortierella sp. GBAus27b]